MTPAFPGWVAKFGDSKWHPVAAWAVVVLTLPDSDECELILPCLVCDNGCLEPTDEATEVALNPTMGA